MSRQRRQSSANSGLLPVPDPKMDLEHVLKLLPEKHAQAIRSFRASIPELRSQDKRRHCEAIRDNLTNSTSEIELVSACYDVLFREHLTAEACSDADWVAFKRISSAGHERLVATTTVSKIWGDDFVRHYKFLSRPLIYCNTLRVAARTVRQREAAVVILNRCIYHRARATDGRIPEVRDDINPIENWDLVKLKKGTPPNVDIAPLEGFGWDKFGLLVRKGWAVEQVADHQHSSFASVSVGPSRPEATGGRETPLHVSPSLPAPSDTYSYEERQTLQRHIAGNALTLLSSLPFASSAERDKGSGLQIPKVIAGYYRKPLPTTSLASTRAKTGCISPQPRLCNSSAADRTGASAPSSEVPSLRNVSSTEVSPSALSSSLQTQHSPVEPDSHRPPSSSVWMENTSKSLPPLPLQLSLQTAPSPTAPVARRLPSGSSVGRAKTRKRSGRDLSRQAKRLCSHYTGLDSITHVDDLAIYLVETFTRMTQQGIPFEMLSRAVQKALQHCKQATQPDPVNFAASEPDKTCQKTRSVIADTTITVPHAAASSVIITNQPAASLTTPIHAEQSRSSPATPACNRQPSCPQAEGLGSQTHSPNVSGYSREVALAYMRADSFGPQFHFPTWNTVPDTALSVTYAIDGNIAGLKTLFENRLASPKDVSSTRGFSLIRWALYGGLHQHETIKFLLSQGAVIDDESYDHVWDFSFRRKCSYEDLHQLSCIRLSGERDWIDDQDFPLPHNIIFGLSGTRLKDELERNPKASKMKDAQGRTALDWATARGQLDDMRILISHGSEVNSMDAAGRTTVLHAVDSHNMEALKILLEAGANPNPQMPGRLARSSPLTSASFGGLAAMVKLLLDYGAEVNACNPEGRSPLTTAMLKHNHVVFKALADWNTNMPTGHVQPPLLSEIAKHADVDTMSIVASSSLSQYLDVDDLTASREALCRREDYDTSLLDAFQSMLPNT